MIQIKTLIGYCSLVAAAISYVFYLRSVLQGRTKPHAFSWTTWGILTSIAFYAQYTNEAGAGAWATCLVAAFCFLVALLAFFIGEKDIRRSDCIMFVGALCILPVWYATKNPLTAVIMVAVIDAFGGYYPTFRKSYYKPHQEMLQLYIIGLIQVILSLFAMEHYYLVNIFYPLFIICGNTAFIAMVVWRRHKMNIPESVVD
ncbi:MAG TPA: hypothetical protein VFT64_07860 [Rickettsiales bacterium]|nr:hypothetical protein [Rickettsiales bacterium]